MLSLFICKDQKQQLELPEAKASTCLEFCPCGLSLTMEPSCHLPPIGQPLPALHRMNPSLCSCLLKVGRLFHGLWLLSSIPLLLCLGTVTRAHHFSPSWNSANSSTSTLFLIQTFCASRDLPISSMVRLDG